MKAQELDFQIYKQISKTYFELIKICLPIFERTEESFSSIKDEKRIFKPKKRKLRYRKHAGSFELQESKEWEWLLSIISQENEENPLDKKIAIAINNFQASFLFIEVLKIKYQYEQIIPPKYHQWYFSEKSKPKSLL